MPTIPSNIAKCGGNCLQDIGYRAQNDYNFNLHIGVRRLLLNTHTYVSTRLTGSEVLICTTIFNPLPNVRLSPIFLTLHSSVVLDSHCNGNTPFCTTIAFFILLSSRMYHFLHTHVAIQFKRNTKMGLFWIYLTEIGQADGVVLVLNTGLHMATKSLSSGC